MSRNKIREILRKHADQLMTVPGVVGIAEGKSKGKPCIKVFVVERNSELLRQIPDNIEGYLLQVEESGEFHALDT